MTSESRKLKRKQKKKAEKELKKHLSMFGKIGGQCSACEKAFDSKSREHVNTWSVVVREEKSTVRLYCPDCWTMAKKIIEQVEIKNDN